MTIYTDLNTPRKCTVRTHIGALYIYKKKKKITMISEKGNSDNN